MKHLLTQWSAPTSAEMASTLLRAAFGQAVGYDIADRGAPDQVFNEEYAMGGMSSGQVSMSLWRETGMPHLEQRACRQFGK